MGPEDILRFARMAKFINPASSTPQELKTLNNLWKVHKDLANQELQLSPGWNLSKAAQAQDMTAKGVGNAYLAGKVLHDPEPRYLQLQTSPDSIAANSFFHPPGYFAQDPNALYIEDLASLTKGGGSGILERLKTMYPDSPWVLQTLKGNGTPEFYERKGFQYLDPDHPLNIGSDDIPGMMLPKGGDLKMKSGGLAHLADGGQPSRPLTRRLGQSDLDIAAQAARARSVVATPEEQMRYPNPETDPTVLDALRTAATALIPGGATKLWGALPQAAKTAAMTVGPAIATGDPSMLINNPALQLGASSNEAEAAPSAGAINKAIESLGKRLSLTGKWFHGTKTDIPGAIPESLSAPIFPQATHLTTSPQHASFFAMVPQGRGSATSFGLNLPENLTPTTGGRIYRTNPEVNKTFPATKSKIDPDEAERIVRSTYADNPALADAVVSRLQSRPLTGENVIKFLSADPKWQPSNGMGYISQLPKKSIRYDMGPKHWDRVQSGLQSAGYDSAEYLDSVDPDFMRRITGETPGKTSFKSLAVFDKSKAFAVAPLGMGLGVSDQSSTPEIPNSELNMQAEGRVPENRITKAADGRVSDSDEGITVSTQQTPITVSTPTTTTQKPLEMIRTDPRHFDQGGVVSISPEEFGTMLRRIINVQDNRPAA